MSSIVKKESSDEALLSDTLNSMYSKLGAMNLVLNSVICRLAEMVENYENIGGSDVLNNVLDWQKDLNAQIAQLLSDINGVHEQYMQIMSASASAKAVKASTDK